VTVWPLRARARPQLRARLVASTAVAPSGEKTAQHARLDTAERPSRRPARGRRRRARAARHGPARTRTRVWCVRGVSAGPLARPTPTEHSARFAAPRRPTLSRRCALHPPSRDGRSACLPHDKGTGRGRAPPAQFGRRHFHILVAGGTAPPRRAAAAWPFRAGTPAPWRRP